MTVNPEPSISVGIINNNVFHWKVIISPDVALYRGALLQAELSFPTNYPDKPPKFKFITEMFHPNIFPDGTVCISILHEPGDDASGYEDKSERWLPVHTVRSIIISVISILNEPNCNSPANVDASKMYRNDYIEYKKKVRELV